MRSIPLLILAAALSACPDSGLRSLRAQPALLCGAGLESGPCDEVDFGEVAVGLSSSRNVRLANQGKARFTVVSSEWSTDSSSAFTSMLDIQSVATNSEEPFVVSFTPTATGSVQGQFTVHLQGNPDQVLRVKGNGTGAPALQVVPETVAFGGVAASTVATQDVTLTNIGNLNLHISALALDPATAPVFTLLGVEGLPVTIAPGAHLTATISYDTSGRMDANTDTGALKIASDDPEAANVTVPISGHCPDCMPPANPDPGCDVNYPHRLWPVAADVATCTRGSTTGPNSVGWTSWAGCGVQRDFAVTPGTEVRIATGTDGCACSGCQLWHINYLLQEDTGSGFMETRHVTQPDDQQCPPTGGQHDETAYTPSTGTLRMVAQYGSSGIGYYFTACGK